MIELDGSFGEGGGQILRTSLALSCLTGKGFKITNIRAKRKNPGLQPQHLSSVELMKAICSARVKGDELNSTVLVFEPEEIKEGDFTIDIGTAGSISLVAITALPVMINRKITLKIRGGTDVPHSPPIDYLRLILIPILEKAGIKGEIGLVRRGHFPKGDGEAVFSFFNAKISEVNLTEFGKLSEIAGISHSTSLPPHVAKRQIQGTLRILNQLKVPTKIIEDTETTGTVGSGIVLAARGDSVIGSSSLGERGVSAEKIGENAAKDLISELSSGAAVDSHMSDILITLSSLTNLDYIGSSFTLHAMTNLEVVKRFVRVNVDLQGHSPFRLKIRNLDI
ncbi:MAG: RNA 3'-terminal phosphate cyclase [Metallosphaera sp.]|uniref:RNA 3'-terminal phosphate cyclase n=1 Tax=Metallosphaera sp. TaxID=2020860 RepID=UPI00317308C1